MLRPVTTLISGLGTSLLTASIAFGGRVDRDVVEGAEWLVGSFDTRAQAEADRVADTAYQGRSRGVGRRSGAAHGASDAVYLGLESARFNSAMAFVAS